MQAGYSKKSLVNKLGIKEGAKVAILNAPENYRATLGPLPKGVVPTGKLPARADFVQYFTRERDDLEGIFLSLKCALSQTGMLWISWPKGASKIPTDLNENVVREIGLAHGLVDIKVCAVDETWSGLKFVYRVKDRK